MLYEVITATKVDGVYDKDPQKHSDAVMFNQLSYIEVLQKKLGVMDSTAITLCMENNVPILVCNLYKGDIKRMMQGENIGTIVQGE